jgi:hypothetical protein
MRAAFAEGLAGGDEDRFCQDGQARPPPEDDTRTNLSQSSQLLIRVLGDLNFKLTGTLLIGTYPAACVVQHACHVLNTYENPIIATAGCRLRSRSRSPEHEGRSLPNIRLYRRGDHQVRAERAEPLIGVC